MNSEKRHSCDKNTSMIYLLRDDTLCQLISDFSSFYLLLPISCIFWFVLIWPVTLVLSMFLDNQINPFFTLLLKWGWNQPPVKKKLKKIIGIQKRIFVYPEPYFQFSSLMSGLQTNRGIYDWWISLSIIKWRDVDHPDYSLQGLKIA